MKNPISLNVRGWLYIAGIIIGMVVATVLPDVMTALNVGQEWIVVATRATGAITALLSLLSRANLSDPTTLTPETESGDL